MDYKNIYGITDDAPIAGEPVILTHPNIPKPLHGVNPRSILGDDWWNKVRQAAYKERDYHCFACGIHKSKAKYHQWLEAHEDYDIDYKTGIVKLKRIVALCHCCHNFIHSGRLEILLDKGEITQEKYDYIIQRGRKILKDAGLNQWTTEGIKEAADWKDWRLIIEGKEYYSKFNNISEWANHYGH